MQVGGNSFIDKNLPLMSEEKSERKTQIKNLKPLELINQQAKSQNINNRNFKEGSNTETTVKIKNLDTPGNNSAIKTSPSLQIEEIWVKISAANGLVGELSHQLQKLFNHPDLIKFAGSPQLVVKDINEAKKIIIQQILDRQDNILSKALFLLKCWLSCSVSVVKKSMLVVKNIQAFQMISAATVS